jgi:hypothetical protein
MKAAACLAALLLCGCVTPAPETPPATTTTSATQETTTVTQPPAPETSTSTSASQPTTTHKATTTTRRPTTTTTLAKSNDKCATTADCGGDRTYLGCNNDKVYRFTQKPTCVMAPEGSYCLSNLKSTVVEACSESQYCANGTCRYKGTGNSTSKSTSPTTTTLKYVFPAQSTTTMTIPAATSCWGRGGSGQARSQSDCEGLKCGTVVGGVIRECVFAGEPGSGHCTCK